MEWGTKMNTISLATLHALLLLIFSVDIYIHGNHLGAYGYAVVWVTQCEIYISEPLPDPKVSEPQADPWVSLNPSMFLLGASLALAVSVISHKDVFQKDIFS